MADVISKNADERMSARNEKHARGDAARSARDNRRVNDIKLSDRYSEQIFSDSFKKWFGDWENDPKNASKVIDEDGKPLVVYHGTDENFTIFDRTKGRANIDIQGMFFSPWELDAKGYGKSVGAYYLNIKNPAPEHIGYKALKKFQNQNYAGVKARDYLISLGYDGVNNGNEEYIAFYPEQIKSATDNIGTYDGNNPDIRYQVRDIVDDNGNDVKNVVLLDTDLFKDVKTRYWGKVVRDFVYNNLAGTRIPVLCADGKDEIIEFARANERVQKVGTKNSHRVIDKLARKNDNLSRLAVVHSVEIIEVSELYSKNRENTHQWLDKNGWDIKLARMMDRKGNIYEVTLNIAKTKDGRSILYDINKIKNIGHGDVSSNAEKVSKRDSHIDPNVYQDDNITLNGSQDENNVKYQYGRGEDLSDRELLHENIDPSTLDDKELKVYNKRGWSYSLFNKEDMRLLQEKFSELRTSKRADNVLADGARIVDINNKIVLIGGTFEEPQVHSVLVINADNETDAEIVKDGVYDESQKIQTRYDYESFLEYVEYIRGKNKVRVYSQNSFGYHKSRDKTWQRAEIPSDFKNYGYTSEQQDRRSDNTETTGSRTKHQFRQLNTDEDILSDYLLDELLDDDSCKLVCYDMGCR